jgi:hypothetical protein
MTVLASILIVGKPQAVSAFPQMDVKLRLPSITRLLSPLPRLLVCWTTFTWKIDDLEIRFLRRKYTNIRVFYSQGRSPSIPDEHPVPSYHWILVILYINIYIHASRKNKIGLPSSPSDVRFHLPCSPFLKHLLLLDSLYPTFLGLFFRTLTACLTCFKYV